MPVFPPGKAYLASQPPTLGWDASASFFAAGCHVMGPPMTACSDGPSVQLSFSWHRHVVAPIGAGHVASAASSVGRIRADVGYRGVARGHRYGVARGYGHKALQLGRV